ncbi:hypothetical protein [Microbacterium sp.]|uniref:hypothetical protein n=1 Tax=Microbacterium sp. TaxID=51671 RepID=UPI003A85487F
MIDLADALLRGARGRRLLLECAKSADEAVSSAMFWRGHHLDPHPGTLLRIPGDEGAPPADPRFSDADVAALIDRADLTAVDATTVRDALRASIDAARYWQEPDGEDIAAARPAVREALRRVVDPVVAVVPDPTAPPAPAQWAVDWRALADSAPLSPDPAALLADWTRDLRADESRATRERPSDPRAPMSGTWWSVPTLLLATRSSIPDALDLIEDSLGWEVATVVPVRGAGHTLEIRSSEDWAALCREYPVEVTASRRHDWFRVTGRDGRWLIPDWERVAQQWDAVHLTTLGYLSAATERIEIDADHASVIAGWAPDSTIWLRDVAREWGESRQEWVRSPDDAQWTRRPAPPAGGDS